MKQYILAIDQGTTSTRAIVFDSRQRVVKVSQKEINVYFPKPSWVEQDANEIWLSVLAVMSDVFADGTIRPEEIEAIGISNQRETTVLWDSRTGLPVYRAIVWQSRQTSDIIRKHVLAGETDMIRRKTGLVPDAYFSASKIEWIMENIEGVKDNPNVLFGTVDSFLLWKLTGGRVHATDVTNASRTMLFNIHDLDWDSDLLKLFGVESSILPEVKDTSGVFGYTDEKLFFNCSVPITALVGDQQAALFGESCFEKGDIKNTYGTGGFILVNTGDRALISDSGLLSTVAWKIGKTVNYALEGSIYVSGSLIQWLRDGLKLFPNAKDTEGLAKSVSSSEGVIVVPAFTGLGAPYWDPDCRGAIFGLTRGVDYRHLVRASLESMAYQSRDLVDLISAELNQKIASIKVDGGAAANSYLLQFQSDILNMPVTKCLNSETTALGACRLAGLATGFFGMDDFGEEGSVVFEPQMNREESDELYSRWKTAVRCCREFK